MKALIITGGECPPPRFVRQLAIESDLVIAADSGLDVAGLAGINPDLVVGDFDSVKDRSLLDRIPPEKKKIYPTDKDDTDTEIALKTAVDMKADYVVIAGGGGGRLDHLVAMLYLFGRANAPREWHTGKESVYFIEAGKALSFELPLESTVSVFPIGTASNGMRSVGLKWPLDDLVWEQGRFGISNRNTETVAQVSAGSTALVVIVPVGCKSLCQ